MRNKAVSEELDTPDPSGNPDEALAAARQRGEGA